MTPIPDRPEGNNGKEFRNWYNGCPELGNELCFQSMGV